MEGKKKGWKIEDGVEVKDTDNREKCWEIEEGVELNFDFTSKIWSFDTGDRCIFITAWKDTDKGPMTEVVLYYGEKGEKKMVIIEILEKKFNEELYSLEKDETIEKVLELCETLSKINTGKSELYMLSSLKPCVRKLAQQLSKVKAIHVYYGNGLFFGIGKEFGKTRDLNSIPRRTFDFPGTRFDTI